MKTQKIDILVLYAYMYIIETEHVTFFVCFLKTVTSYFCRTNPKISNVLLYTTYFDCLLFNGLQEKNSEKFYFVIK